MFKTIGELPVKVAKLKLIQVSKDFSVARIVKMFEKENTPITGHDSVMVGDMVEVGSGE